MYHYYFIERNSGEEFIVGADTLEEAWMTAKWVALSLDENPDLDGALPAATVGSAPSFSVVQIPQFSSANLV